MSAQSGYDYIILGAGSAGCVLANRLSADPAVRVLLVEAGGRDVNPLIRVPVMAGRWFVNPYLNWSFQTEPQHHLDGRRISWPRGKVWGGTSSINGMIYVRGHPRDYDGWASGGMHSWAWPEVLPYFRKAERFAAGEDALHGGSGPLPVTRPQLDNPLYAAFVAACADAGHPLCVDFNGADPHGAGYYDYNILAGQRWSAARAYLRPALGRANLDVLSRAHVLRVTIEGGWATGVELSREGRCRHVRADGEVILAAGVVGSPAILLHSGIGDAHQLSALGIGSIADLPGVGCNLQDHLQVMVTQRARVADNVYDLRRADRAAFSVARALVTGKGPATTFPTLAGAFLKSRPDIDRPDIQLHFILGAGGRDLRWPWQARPGGQGYGFTGSVCQLRPHSRGRIFLKSADPLAAPGIEPRYLSSVIDREVMRDGVRMMRDIFAQQGLDPYRDTELGPGREVRSDAEIDAWIAASAQSIYHPVGSCRMGTGADAVVDERLRVRGIAGLRVADASIMPEIVGGNTHAATVMIAEKAADMIRNSARNYPADTEAQHA